ncbi:MAG TPA: phosphoadenylyl-sulfate reductase [Symbiobacteriaceae bacterium]|nr:phosphoadenylyl-sulfate reductase [Symbiobacteriaceae bacterium]
MGEQILTEAALADVAASLEGKEPQAALQWAFEHFGMADIALACSFGAEDVALVDMVARLRPGTRVFYLDTNLLFSETYELIDRVKARYDIKLERVLPLLSLEEQAGQHGDALWSREPDSCCGIRKVEPLKRALGTMNAWITGIRREQAPTRANAKMVEWDAKFGLVKINPLVAWTDKDVWRYIMANGVPYNPLHDQGYPSIGCTHCTRAVKPGEDPRAGRWSSFAKTECGLHK